MMNMNIKTLIEKAPRDELEVPPKSLDHADHILQTALKGYPELAADHILYFDFVGKLVEIVGSLIRRARLVFMRSGSGEEVIVRRARIYDVLIEILVNLYGMEREWVGFKEDEVKETEFIIRNALKELENIEIKETGKAAILRAVIELKIEDMKKVMAGDPKRKGMITVMGENIEQSLDHDNLVDSFLDSIKNEIQNNIYYIMSKHGMCRFGNDYAIGLRWLRRLGYVQVSTNPQLAAIAYRDDPSLWDKFKDYLRKHPYLLDDPNKRADELAMAATMLALWPNMEVFRPIFFLKDYMDGMISYQLNPNVANSVEGSLRDAYKIYTTCEEYFRKYDAYLIWGWSLDVERGRPNIVFKVAGSSPAAISITSGLESRGMGTNNTVVYTVAQEARLILAKFEGMSKAVKLGIKVTRNYETNMGGRLDDHIREEVAAQLLAKALEKVDNKEEALFELAKELGLNVDTPIGMWKGPSGWGYDIEADSLDKKIKLVTSRAFLRPLYKEAFASFLSKYGLYDSKEEAIEKLKELEGAIGMSGTLVAQRVWWIFFSPENKHKWLAWLIKKYGISPEQAKRILDSIDVLPASKRKPLDTYYTLARNNMTNTEFPDHQLKVLNMSKQPSFNLKEFDNAITKTHDKKYIEILSNYPDFVKAYEYTPELIKIFKEVGISVDEREDRGLRPSEWGSFGSTVKTMTGFTESYNKFRDKCVSIAL